MNDLIGTKLIYVDQKCTQREEDAKSEPHNPCMDVEQGLVRVIIIIIITISYITAILGNQERTTVIYCIDCSSNQSVLFTEYFKRACSLKAVVVGRICAK